MKKLRQLKTNIAAWSETRGARAGIGLLALALAYVFIRWALDRGSLLDYAIALTLAVFALREWVLAVLPPRGGHKP